MPRAPPAPRSADRSQPRTWPAPRRQWHPPPPPTTPLCIPVRAMRAQGRGARLDGGAPSTRAPLQSVAWRRCRRRCRQGGLGLPPCAAHAVAVGGGWGGVECRKPLPHRGSPPGWGCKKKKVRRPAGARAWPTQAGVGGADRPEKGDKNKRNARTIIPCWDPHTARVRGGEGEGGGAWGGDGAQKLDNQESRCTCFSDTRPHGRSAVGGRAGRHAPAGAPTLWARRGPAPPPPALATAVADPPAGRAGGATSAVPSRLPWRMRLTVTW